MAWSQLKTSIWLVLAEVIHLARPVDFLGILGWLVLGLMTGWALTSLLGFMKSLEI